MSEERTIRVLVPDNVGYLHIDMMEGNGNDRPIETITICIDDLEPSPPNDWVPKCWTKETQTRFGCINYDKFSSYPGCVDCPYRKHESLEDKITRISKDPEFIKEGDRIRNDMLPTAEVLNKKYK